MDGQAVAEGEEVAGCKVTPVAVPGHLIAHVEQMCRQKGPVVQLLPFRPLRTFVVATERLKPKARELFRAAVTAKLGWYGAEVLAVREVARSGAVAVAYRATRWGAQLVLFKFTSAISRPRLCGADERVGTCFSSALRMHPGMLWLGRFQEAAVVGVASCACFGRSSSLDLLPSRARGGRAGAATASRSRRLIESR
jgi:hypothetical protein